MLRKKSVLSLILGGAALQCLRENWNFDLQVEQSASEQMPRRGICQ
jgi:hypothetical protein